jgi:uncharacterized protein (TIGR00251 family)
LSDSLRLSLRVSPRSSRPGIGGWREGADGRRELEIRVAAAPADGAANDEVIRLLAKAIGVQRSAVAITSGATGRLKMVEIDGVAAEAIERLASA